MVHRPIDSMTQQEQAESNRESQEALKNASSQSINQARLLQEDANRQTQANYKAETKRQKFGARMAKRQAENLKGGEAFLKWLEERVFPESYQGYDNLLALLMKQFAIAEQFGKAYQFSYVDMMQQGLNALTDRAIQQFNDQKAGHGTVSAFSQFVLGVHQLANKPPSAKLSELPQLTVQFTPKITADGKLDLTDIRDSDNNTSLNHQEREFLNQITTAWLLKNGYKIGPPDYQILNGQTNEVITPEEFEALRVDPTHGLDAFIQSLPGRLRDIALEQHQAPAPRP